MYSGLNVMLNVYLGPQQAVGKCWNLGIRFRGTQDFARHKFGEVNANCLIFLSLKTFNFSRMQKIPLSEAKVPPSETQVQLIN